MEVDVVYVCYVVNECGNIHCFTEHVVSKFWFPCCVAGVQLINFTTLIVCEKNLVFIFHCLASYWLGMFGHFSVHEQCF